MVLCIQQDGPTDCLVNIVFRGICTVVCLVAIRHVNFLVVVVLVLVFYLVGPYDIFDKLFWMTDRSTYLVDSTT